MTFFEGFVYCIDTSALVDLKKTYPRNVFSSLWDNFEKMILSGRIIAPKEVFEELKQFWDKNDDLMRLAKKNKKMFKSMDYSQLQQVTNILKKFPLLVDASKQIPDADPFIVALALSDNCTIITQESQSRPNRIPEVCRSYGIKCISLLDFFIEQGWKF